jgi:U3 small nucleolar RNA-associated protein 21
VQWENLLHLDTIKARSKPLAPPKKPEAAPFFLPTVPGLSRTPVFAADGSAKEGEAAEDGEAGESSSSSSSMCRSNSQQHSCFPVSLLRFFVCRCQLLCDTYATLLNSMPNPHCQNTAGPSSRVLRTRGVSVSAAAAPTAFVALLRSSKAAGDFASFISHLRGLSPAALDLELRAMMVLEGSGLDEAADEGSEEVQDVGLLLEALQGELDAARNFEMVQALLVRVLVVSWVGLGASCLYKHVRCMQRMAAPHACAVKSHCPPPARTQALLHTRAE